MTQWRELFRERLVVVGLIYGGLASILGYYFTLGAASAAMGGYSLVTTEGGFMRFATFAKFLIVSGPGSIIVSLAYGFWTVFRENSGPMVKEKNCRIMARYGFDANHVMVTDEFDLGQPGIKFYVKMWSPTRGAVEYQTTEQVFWMCGEGMTGEATSQGKWLGQFTPFIGVGPAVEGAANQP